MKYIVTQETFDSDGKPISIFLFGTLFTSMLSAIGHVYNDFPGGLMLDGFDHQSITFVLYAGAIAPVVIKIAEVKTNA